MRDREEEVFRHERISFLSDLLALKHKHRKYMTKAGYYDPVATAIRSLEAAMKAAKDARKNEGQPTKRSALKGMTHNVVYELLGLGKYQHAVIRVGHKPSGSRKVKNRTAHYDISVGWMWLKKVYDVLYAGCAIQYGPWMILQAERVRVNSKHVELFEVTAFHKGNGDTAKGYVAKTKSPLKACIFNTKAITAVKSAEYELERELDLLLKGTSNDQDTRR
jgi:hypothetical protein